MVKQCRKTERSLSVNKLNFKHATRPKDARTREIFLSAT
jgi:hypothetical protein